MPLFLLSQPRCVYAHIPKTGGNSIRNVVFQKNYEGPWFGESLPDEWSHLFKFAFVRNPFDRLVSAWKMFCEGTVDDAWKLPEGGLLNMSLKEVVELGLDSSALFGHPWYNKVKRTPLVRLKNHIVPQTHPYHGLQFIDYVGRFENLSEDFAFVANKLGLDSTELPKTNWTRKRNHYREYFDSETRQLAEQLYQEDLRELKYQFD